MKNTALITGASSGIGRELARIHAAQGGDLILVARRQEALQSLADELKADHGTESLVIAADLTREEAPQEIYNLVSEAGITVEYLINNAGFGGRGKFHERAWEEDRSMIQVNIVALSALTRLFLPDMVARNSGRILNVSSTASLTPGPLQAVYFASKSYVTFFSNALLEELHDTNVTVTALLPGATETEFAQVSGMDKTGLFDKTVTAQSVAQDGYDAMMAGEMEVISGLQPMQKFLFRLMKFFPKRMALRQIRQMQDV